MNEDPTKKFNDQSNGRFDELFQMVRAIRTEMSELRQTVDARLYDTRPIWEKVQADISQLQDGQQRLAETQQSLVENQQKFEERLQELHDDMRAGFRNLKRQFAVLHETFLETRADFQALDRRLYRIEEGRNSG